MKGNLDKMLSILTGSAIAGARQMSKNVHASKHSEQTEKKPNLTKEGKAKKRKRQQQKASRRRNRKK